MPPKRKDADAQHARAVRARVESIEEKAKRLYGAENGELYLVLLEFMPWTDLVPIVLSDSEQPDKEGVLRGVQGDFAYCLLDHRWLAV